MMAGNEADALSACLVFLARVTHPILDCFTVYGTRVVMM